MVKSVSILGSTGSIGRNTVDLIQSDLPAFDVVALTANTSVEKLVEQARVLKPQFVALADERQYEALKEALEGSGIRCGAGEQALIEAASMPCDWTMAAIVGMAGLKPTMAAIAQGNTVAFASKECLVSAGKFMMHEVEKHGTTLLPTDSEHNAIFQVFEEDNKNAIDRLILTASGGPFRQSSLDEMRKVTPEVAVKHPNWSMGAKISVDSATMMNKALELIEAKYLFDFCEDRIDIVVHPESIIHSMVEYTDGSILAQLGPSDMRTPIASCLAWPKRMKTSGPKLDFRTVSSLNFEEPDLERFPSLALVREVLKKDTSYAVAFNAVNEIAVDAFLKKQLGFLDIVMLNEAILEKLEQTPLNCLDDVIFFDNHVRELTQRLLSKGRFAPNDNNQTVKREQYA